ncbi:hypothetical protein V2O64_07040 [Verrucomicrobiaceae bacterium 227]
MKLRFLIPALMIPFVFADEKDHDHKAAEEHAEHDHEIKAPNGGRVLHDVVPHAEFFITKERKVQITFVDGEGKPVADASSVKAIGGKRTEPTKFTFEKTEHGFLSKEKLPEGNLVPIVLMFKNGEGKAAKPIKFNVNMEQCPTCDFLEYACICDHEGEGHEDHDHEDHKD